MKIAITQLGGMDPSIVFNLPVIDTANLAPSATSEVQALLARLKFFDLPEHVVSDDLGSDLMQYRISVTDGARQHVVRVDQGAMARTGLLRLIELASA
ncbi:MAG: hypothetical protein M0P19_11410 [Nevskia sp.]|jgi:hypothetical protein|nr:hypothetical protein [Nevskia sp.]MCK9385651.1 hypothetical protein [Nevskia sp.]